MSEWFYARGGQQNGPVNFDQLQEIARSGGLEPADLVWTSSMKDWQPAGKIDGMFVDVASPATPPADPSNPYAAPQTGWNEPQPATGSALQEIMPGSDPIDVGACVKRGFEITKRNFGTILLVGLTYFGVLDSLRYSSAITTNNRLNLFLLALLSIAIFIAGALALLVGLIFAYPLIWMSWMVAFRWMQYGSRAAEDHPGTSTPLLSGI